MTGYLHAEGDSPGEQDGAADGASQELVAVWYNHGSEGGGEGVE